MIGDRHDRDRAGGSGSSAPPESDGRPDDVDVATRHAASAQPRAAAPQPYPLWFLLPAVIVYAVLFLVPTFSSFYFSLTRWTLFDIEFIGLENFVTFFTEP